MNDNEKHARKRQIKLRMQEITRSVGQIARIARFMTEEQLKPYEEMAAEHERLEKEFEEL